MVTISTAKTRAAHFRAETRARNRSVCATRFGLLILVSAVLLVACGPPPSERPREGAPVGGTSRPVTATDGGGPIPTLSPPAALGNALPPLGAPGGSPQTGALPASPSPSPSPAPAHVIVATDGAGANLRTGPSTAAPVVTTLAEGTLVEILGDPVSVEGRSWRQIRSGGREGWVVSVVVRPR